MAVGRARNYTAAELLALAVLRQPDEGTPIAELVDEAQASLTGVDGGTFVTRAEILDAFRALVATLPGDFRVQVWSPAYRAAKELLREIDGEGDDRGDPKRGVEPRRTMR